jgi:MFS superfamily sulfate permease-like transporter
VTFWGTGSQIVLLQCLEHYQFSWYVMCIQVRGNIFDIMKVYSSTLFFFRAGGKRLEAALVTLVTLGFFFASSYVLPYIPTIQASALVLFFGIELVIEALWDSSDSLLLCEWVVVAGTTLACSFLGFAPGIGIGLVTVAIVSFLRDTFESVGHVCGHGCTRANIDCRNLELPSLVS